MAAVSMKSTSPPTGVPRHAVATDLRRAIAHLGLVLGGAKILSML
jgi:hypothetical protein